MSRIVRPLFESSHEVVGVIESAPRYFRRDLVGKLSRNIIGCFRNLSSRPTLEKLCEEKGTKYCLIDSKNQLTVAQWVRELNPDIVVVYSMSQLLREEIFSIPKFGTINVHPSYLPEYRGPNPGFWQYYDMVMDPGVTIHYIDQGEDTGDIIFRERLPVELGVKSPQQVDMLVGGLGVNLLLNALSLIPSGKAPRIPQPVVSPTSRARNLSPSEHGKIIDWTSWPIEHVWHVLRGTELWLKALPLPKGASAFLRWEVGELKKFEVTGKPFGRVLKEEGRYVVYAKGGVIFLKLKLDLRGAVMRILLLG